MPRRRDAPRHRDAPHHGDARPLRDATRPQEATLRRVRRSILAWYASEHREFPWRRTRDPYAVLVSEVMLQQTQASRVAERFPRFLVRFPTAEALAAASPADVLAEWSGLGYNRRALALQRCAVEVVSHGWPTSVAELERLPGIGPYTARAVASLAFGIPAGVVDTNVRRWLVRRFGLRADGADARLPALQALADRLAWTEPSGADAAPATVAAWTHASMELGGRVCTARHPACDRCPIARGCPSRSRPARVPVARQPTFEGSSRAVRGALLRALAESPGQRLAIGELLSRVASRDGANAAIAALERETLLHRSGDVVGLGPRREVRQPETPRAKATIGR